MAYIILAILGPSIFPPFAICLMTTELDLETCSFGIWSNDYIWSRHEYYDWCGTIDIFPYYDEQPITIEGDEYVWEYCGAEW